MPFRGAEDAGTRARRRRALAGRRSRRSSLAGAEQSLPSGRSPSAQHSLVGVRVAVVPVDDDVVEPGLGRDQVLRRPAPSVELVDERLPGFAVPGQPVGIALALAVCAVAGLVQSGWARAGRLLSARRVGLEAKARVGLAALCRIAIPHESRSGRLWRLIVVQLEPGGGARPQTIGHRVGLERITPWQNRMIS